MSDDGFRRKWPIDDDYCIQDQRLAPILKDKKWKTLYAPGGREELPGEIAKLERDDQDAVLAFARRYGVLGFFELSRTETNHPYGDPLNWIWLHAETLGLCLSLKEMLDRREIDSLNRRLMDFPQGSAPPDYPAPRIVFASRGTWQQSNFFVTNGPNRTDMLQGLAASILSTIVNANIAQLHPALAWNAKRQMFAQHFQFTALIEVAYWHIANVLRGGTVARCDRPGCRGIFIQTDRRQRFCPTGTKQESTCAVRERVQRKRERDREAKQQKKKLTKKNMKGASR